MEKPVENQAWNKKREHKRGEESYITYRKRHSSQKQKQEGQPIFLQNSSFRSVLRGFFIPPVWYYQGERMHIKIANLPKRTPAQKTNVAPCILRVFPWLF